MWKTSTTELLFKFSELRNFVDLLVILTAQGSRVRIISPQNNAHFVLSLWSIVRVHDAFPKIT